MMIMTIMTLMTHPRRIINSIINVAFHSIGRLKKRNGRKRETIYLNVQSAIILTFFLSLTHARTNTYSLFLSHSLGSLDTDFVYLFSWNGSLIRIPNDDLEAGGGGVEPEVEIIDKERRLKQI